MGTAEVRTRVLVREVMNNPVVTSGPDTSARELAVMMKEREVGSVIIIEDERFIGIVTDGDIARRVVAEGRVPERVKARELMSTPLLVVDSETEVTEALKMMRSFKVKHLGVVYKNELAGIVSMSDLIYVTPELLSTVFEKSMIEAWSPRRYRGRYSGYCDVCGGWSDDMMEIDGRFICEECRMEYPSES